MCMESLSHTHTHTNFHYCSGKTQIPCWDEKIGVNSCKPQQHWDLLKSVIRIFLATVEGGIQEGCTGMVKRHFSINI